MLLQLNIKNFAIISQLQLQFYKGMTALTGETGAGKSIIIDAMSLLAGSRSSSDFIREGSESCLLEGLFEIPEQPAFLAVAEELGLDLNDDQLVVQRDIYLTGKSICRINGRIVTLGNLRRVGEYLVDIQGQNDHQELMRADRHLNLLDSFGAKDFQEAKETYHNNYNEVSKQARELERLKTDEQSYVQRVDMLTFQKEEIEAAELAVGEEESLLEERDKLSNFQRIVDTFSTIYQRLTDEQQGALDNVGSASQEISEIADLDSEYQQISENIHSAYYLLQDASSEITRIIEGLELDEGRLEVVMQRLELIRQLKRKYGNSVAEILSYYQKISDELSDSVFSDGRLDQLEKEVATKWQKVTEQAVKLHDQRKKMALRLEKEILEELKGLYMENSQFEVRFTKAKELNSDGFDIVEFYISTNPGEPLKPLVRVASGGELSRVMLALKTIFSKVQGITSIVFDEVDTGVSGRVAQAIAEKIYKIAQNSQVLCITHLPQVAAAADNEYFIYKEVIGQRTETRVKQLDEEQRVAEIARMLAGSEVTELALEHAKELLRQARHSN
ncbi:DNA repair protein RecN [Enterococcus sp. LJL120]